MCVHTRICACVCVHDSPLHLLFPPIQYVVYSTQTLPICRPTTAATTAVVVVGELWW